MIAIDSSVTFVVHDDGRRSPFSVDKLARSLTNAAQLAGHTHWQMAEHVAATVGTYLEKDWPSQTIPRAQLLQAVVIVLKALGYSDIAAVFRQIHEYTVVDLAQLARESPLGFEMEFFRLLGNRLDQLSAAGQNQVQFRNLRHCVKILSGRQRWRSKCKGLSDELLAFIRGKLVANSQNRDCSFVVSS